MKAKFDIQWWRNGAWHSVGTGTFDRGLKGGLDKAAHMLSLASEQVIGQHVEFDPRDIRLVPIER